MLIPPVKRKPPRQMSPAGLATLKPLECRNGRPDLKAFQDIAGVWTLGYGHTGPDVYEGVTCTEEAAEQLLDTDLDKVEWAICKNVAFTQLSQHEFDALAMLLYNAGVGVLDQPHFKAAIAPDAAGKIDKTAVALQFPKWVYVTDRKTGKKVKSKGLINRRAAELAVWNTPDYLAPVAGLPRLALDLGPDQVPKVRITAPAPLVPIPVETASVTPLPPPATIGQAPGGKSFLVTIGSVLVATGGELVKQVNELVTDLQQIKTSTDPYGKVGHLAAIAIGVTVIGVACFTYWQRHREVKHG